jgi:hypothetical protein
VCDDRETSKAVGERERVALLVHESGLQAQASTHSGCGAERSTARQTPMGVLAN